MRRRHDHETKKADILTWRVVVLPGFVSIGLIVIARLMGLMQSLEWSAFDTFLRLRPLEPTDERVIIIGINESDIQRVGKYPIPDQEIARLIEILEQFHPKAIGLDLVRDLPVEPGHEKLIQVYQKTPHLIGVKKALPDSQQSDFEKSNCQYSIKPPPELPSQQVGFADVLLDADGKVRRALLGMEKENCPVYEFSFAILLVQKYLETEVDNGKYDPVAMRFRETELPRLIPHFDFPHLAQYLQGYFPNNSGQSSDVADYLSQLSKDVNDDFGVQTLINFRNNPQKPFRILSLQDIEEGNFQERDIRDRVVIIGMTASSIRDLFSTSSGSIYGVEVHAHVVSQILSAVEDERPLLKTWSDGWEYLWIIGWGFLGMSLSYFTQSPSKNFLLVGISSLILVGISYFLLIESYYWVPVVPALFVLVFNGIGLLSFYQHHRTLKAVMDERQRAIEHTFTVIHNGPLQILANLLRQVRDRNLPSEHLIAELENLNHEIREVGEYLKGESLTQENSVRLGDRVRLDLKRPIHELFYEVFSNVLERDLPCLETLKVKVRSFEPIEPEVLNQDQKRELCEFLEEILCNVGKHAQGVTRLSATGTYKEGWYTLSIKDNGLGKVSHYEGRGTKQCKHLAKQLKGYFTREILSPQGMLCELTWFLGKAKK